MNFEQFHQKKKYHIAINLADTIVLGLNLKFPFHMKLKKIWNIISLLHGLLNG